MFHFEVFSIYPLERETIEAHTLLGGCQGPAFVRRRGNRTTWHAASRFVGTKALSPDRRKGSLKKLYPRLQKNEALWLGAQCALGPRQYGAHASFLDVLQDVFSAFRTHRVSFLRQHWVSNIYQYRSSLPSPSTAAKLARALGVYFVTYAPNRWSWHYGHSTFEQDYFSPQSPCYREVKITLRKSFAEVRRQLGNYRCMKSPKDPIELATAARVIVLRHRGGWDWTNNAGVSPEGVLL